MKRLVKKNQIMITALAVMIAVAGYLNYTGRMFGAGTEAAETNGDIAKQELLDISMEDETASNEVKTPEGTPGEAVLTNGEVSGIVAEAKVTREQVRAQNKETLMDIIENKELSDAQKETAISQLLAMTKRAELEAGVETMLTSKGFSETVVSLTETTADIVVNSEELTDANRAQIEDVVQRKTGISPEKIVITPAYEEKNKKEP